MKYREKTYNLNDYANRAYNIAAANGWHERELSNTHFLCLVISELMEAVEWDRIGSHAKKDSFERMFVNMSQDEKRDWRLGDGYRQFVGNTVEEELADAFIRLFDLAGYKEIDIDAFDYENDDHEDYFDMTFTESVFSVIKQITEGDQDDWELETSLALILNEMFGFCEENDIDIFWFIDLKMDYNETRGYHHGGKKY